MRTIFLALSAAVGLTCAAGAGDIPNRLPQAKVGEWLLLRDVSGERSGELTRFSVAEIHGDGQERTLVMRMEKLDADGAAVETRDIDILLSRYAGRMADLEDKAKQISRERLVVKDRELPVIAVSWDDEDGGREFKLWVSAELPIGGLVKSWSSDPDFPAAELIDYGFP